MCASFFLFHGVYAIGWQIMIRAFSISSILHTPWLFCSSSSSSVVLLLFFYVIIFSFIELSCDIILMFFCSLYSEGVWNWRLTEVVSRDFFYFAYSIVRNFNIHVGFIVFWCFIIHFSLCQIIAKALQHIASNTNMLFI